MATTTITSATGRSTLFSVGDRVLIGGAPAVVTAVTAGATVTVRWRNAWYWRALYWFQRRWQVLMGRS